MSSDNNNEQLLLDLVKDYRATAVGLQDECNNLLDACAELNSKLEAEKSALLNEKLRLCGLMKMVEAHLAIYGNHKNYDSAKDGLTPEGFNLWVTLNNFKSETGNQ